jgi:hypothetical protein
VLVLDDIAAKKGGRASGSTAYSRTEHVALLSIIADTPDSFNASESSPQWEAVFKAMVEQFYLNKSVRTSSALHGYFVDMYSAFKQAICQLSLSPYDKKSPSVYVHGDPEVEAYLDQLDNLLQSCTKNFFSKKWWSHEVVEMFFPLHFAYSAEFGSRKQSTLWLSEKSLEHKSKFETDQKNRLDELARKRKAEEEEHLDAAKNRKQVADASAQLVLAFQQFSTPPANVDSVAVAMEGKMAAMKENIMAEIGAKMEENNHEVKDALNSILGFHARFDWES